MPARKPKDELGHAGERHARLILEAQGYAYVASNWHCRAGELDLVMTHGDLLVFVEVKTRRGERAGRAEEAITTAKARKLLAAAEWFVGEHPEFHDRIWRCDIMAITIDERSGTATHRHIVNAIVAG
ncbi:MAG TPA: YraN family protein [Thermomicrobiales bacterium]|nr:YraN family protein [Thermomicrobiales bacterium]